MRTNNKQDKYVYGVFWRTKDTLNQKTEITARSSQRLLRMRE